VRQAATPKQTVKNTAVTISSMDKKWLMHTLATTTPRHSEHGQAIRGMQTLCPKGGFPQVVRWWINTVEPFATPRTARTRGVVKRGAPQEHSRIRSLRPVGSPSDREAKPDRGAGRAVDVARQHQLLTDS
jgi:hypothetical protein